MAAELEQAGEQPWPLVVLPGLFVPLAPEITLERLIGQLEAHFLYTAGFEVVEAMDIGLSNPASHLGLGGDILSAKHHV